MARIKRQWDALERYVSEDYVIAFQEVLRSAIKEKGMSHSDLAEVLGVSRARVSQLLMEGTNPSLRYVGLVLFRLGYSVEFRKLPELSNQKQQNLPSD